jgi:hypothetical protein
MKALLSTRKVMTAILGLGLFAMGARNATDPDLWWHLRTGQLILQKHAVLHTDPFSFTRYGQSWINHEWLSDVLIFSLYRFGGWGALIYGFAVVIAAMFLLAYTRCPKTPYIAAIFTVWAALASAPLCAARPQMFSLLLVSTFLLVLERSAERPRLLWWIPALMLLWVNLHAGFIAGLALLFLFIIGEWLDRVFGVLPGPPVTSRLRHLILTLFASLAVVALNPYGTEMYTYPLATLRSAAMQKHIVEWFSPDFHQPQYFPALLMVMFMICLLGISTHRLRVREIVLLSATFFAGLVSVRHLPIFALVAVPLMTELTQTWIPSLALSREDISGAERNLSPNKLAANVLLLTCVATFAVLWSRTVVQRQVHTEAAAFPAAGVAFLLSHHLPGPIFNHYDWGGYLAWRAYPEYRVFIDGRADLYGDPFMDDFANSYSLRNHWQVGLREWGIKTVFVPANSALLNGLRLLPEWKEVYRDQQSVIVLHQALP